MDKNIATKHVRFSGRLLMLGCGSIGQGMLPLLLRHIDMPRENISILTADARGSQVAAGQPASRPHSAGARKQRCCPRAPGTARSAATQRSISASRGSHTRAEPGADGRATPLLFERAS